jgi:hypothetical protein
MSRYSASGRQALPQDGVDFIPANPPVERPWFTAREAVALVNPEPQGRMTVKYDETTCELTVITFQEPLPSESNLKFLLAEERAKHPVNILTFVFSNHRADESVPWLISKKFSRSESKYAHASMISFSKSYVKTEKPSTSDASTVEEKLAEAKRLTKTTPEPVPVVGDFRPRVTT